MQERRARRNAQSRNGRPPAPRSRFANVWSDAIAAEAAALEQHRVERQYRRMLALTDGVLGRLEQRNLAGQEELDEVIQRDIARTLSVLPPDARGRFPQATSVQQALDGIFEVQEALLHVLQRMLHWDRLLAAPWGADEPLAERRTA
ncbi:MAG TPA: hypothetical protein VOB72_24260 [Candidatus Dormibacteraeota bacterium]|nr:hypothetical protein [Candidatus Dormibacteraeota bacterium]